MGGTGNAAIDKFKTSFGGKPISHARWVYRSKLAQLAERVFMALVKKGWIKANA